MSKTPSPYPNLRYYAKSSRLANTIKTFKRPESWVVAVAVFTFTLLGPVQDHLWLFGAGVGALFVATSLVMQRIRYGPKGWRKMMADGLRDAMPMRIGRLVQQGRLAQTIGDEGADLLERCAGHFIATGMEVARTTIFVTGVFPLLSLRKEISETTDRGVKDAMLCFQMSILTRAPSPRVDMARAQDIEQELAKLEDEVVAWAESLSKEPEKFDISPIRQQLQTMREFETGVRSGEVRLGEVDLEKKAREGD